VSVLRLAEATWIDVRELVASSRGEAVVIVPVGATEAHGPHLPLGTDVVIAEGMARRAAVALEGRGYAVAIAPALVYSVTEYAGGFRGTAGIGPEAAAAYLKDVLAGLRRAGFGRICLANAHLEPAHVAVLRAAAAAESDVVLADPTERRFARTLTEEFKRGACHAGSYETSLVLAERPELVRNDARAGLRRLDVDLAKAMKAGVRTFQEAGAADAYFGDPAAATIEEGEEIYRRLVDMVVTVITERWRSA
jgi:creatinine amidohydrolase